MNITDKEKREIGALVQELDQSRNKAMHYLQNGKFQAAGLHFNLEARTSDKISELLNDIHKKQ